MAATYEIANYISAVEQLTMTTLRNIVGGMDLEQTLTSRGDGINRGLSGVLDEATTRWGIRVGLRGDQGHRPAAVDQGLDGEADARRPGQAGGHPHRRGPAPVLDPTAEGNKQAAILNAEGEREARILRAQAEREAAILRAQGEGQAIQTVFQAIHDGQPDQSLLAYQYLQMLPKIAEGDANKVWVVPSEITKALEGLGSAVHEVAGIPKVSGGPRVRVDTDAEAARSEETDAQDFSDTHREVEKAIAAAEESSLRSGAAPVTGTGPVPPSGTGPVPPSGSAPGHPGRLGGDPGDPSGEEPTGK